MSKIQKISSAFSSLSRLIRAFPIFISYLNTNISVSNVPTLKIAAQYTTCFSNKQMEINHASAQMLLGSWLNWYSQTNQ